MALVRKWRCFNEVLLQTMILLVGGDLGRTSGLPFLIPVKINVVKLSVPRMNG